MLLRNNSGMQVSENTMPVIPLSLNSLRYLNRLPAGKKLMTVNGL